MTILEPDLQDPVLDEGDHDRFSHIVRKSDANRAYIEGIIIEALCGKRWVPSRDPERYPVCQTCLDVRARMMHPGAQ